MWLLATILKRKEKKLAVIRIAKDALKSWREKTLDILDNLAIRDLQSLPEKILWKRHCNYLIYGVEKN